VRKLWYAGAAVASGILLFAASPARADVQPAGTAGSTPSDLLPGNSIAPPFGDLLSGAGGYALTQGGSAVAGARGMAMSSAGHALTGANDAAGQARNGLDRVRRPTNNLHVTIPLDGSRPLTQVRPGSNSPLLPGQRSAEGLPSADVIGPLQPDTPLTGGGGGGLLGGNLFGQLPLLSTVLPNGQQQSFDSLDRPTTGDTESDTDGMPLLGGLGGVLPVNGLPSVPGGDVPDVTGLPGGGMAVLAPADAPAKPAKPAKVKPAAAAAPAGAPTAATSSAAPTADPADPRLHEEPIDGEAAQRTFSPDGRPVAGIDQQYK
jgi:hypothetical protein